MAQHMASGDYYHIGINRRHGMRGGSTQAERGEAAELREMNPKTEASKNTTGDLTRPSSQLNYILNQVVHDKSTDPIEREIPGVMGLIRSIKENNTAGLFKREPTPTQSQLTDRANDIVRINRIMTEGAIQRINDGVYEVTENAGVPLADRYAALAAAGYYIPDQHKMVTQQLLHEATANFIELPPGLRNNNEQLFALIEHEKRLRGV